jgi:ArsR family transcriptional regulator
MGSPPIFFIFILTRPLINLYIEIIHIKKFIKKRRVKKVMEPCRPILKFDNPTKFDIDKISAIHAKTNALANPIRLKIIKLLLDNKDLCVCEIETALGLKQSKVSYHLGALIKGGFITRRQDGPWSFYRLNDNATTILKLFGFE